MARRLPLIVAVLLLAGCVAPVAPPPSDSSDPKDDLEFTEETGGVIGFVFDDEAKPVDRVALQLLPLGATATSAFDGSFSFSNVPPGSYSLFAAKLGFEAGASKVEVVAGEAATAQMVLVPITVGEPRKEVFGPFTGFMQCRMSTPLSSGACGFLPLVGNTSATSIWTNDKVIWNFGKFTSEDYAAITFESRWTPSSAATNPNMMQTFSYDGRPGTHWWADSGGQASPIRFTWVRGEDGPGGQITSDTPEEHEEPTSAHLLRTWLTIPFGSETQPAEVAYDLRFEMMVTIWYSETPAETYSAFSDA